MKPYTGDTHGRNHYFLKPKEHKVPKSSADRKGVKSSVRHKVKLLLVEELSR